MGQALKISEALVICSHADSRHIACTLIEESGFEVLEADTMEDGAAHLMQHAQSVSLVFAEANDAEEARRLALLIQDQWPWIKVLVAIDHTAVAIADMPHSAILMRRPWRPLDLLIEAERATK